MHKNTVQSHEGWPALAATAAQPIIRKAALASAVALALLGVSLDAQALALGAISVRSALGEPLRAEIEIPQLSSEEASTLQASMGTPQAFRAAGINYSPALADARVTLQRRANGQAYLRIVGNRPVNEPYVGVVIEANWANGRVVRDYTLLLDPPGREALPAVVATQPQAPAPEPSAAPARPAVAEQVTPRSGAAPAPKASPRPERAAASGGGEQVAIQRGDTLSRIAGAHAIDGVSLDQMMVALLQANPQAFIRGNVNLIKAGAVLQMPSAEQALTTSRQAARRAVVAQSRDFQAYRRSVAKAAPAQPQDAGGSQTASGSVQAQVSERQAPAPAPDQLKISKGGAASGAETTVARSRQAQEQADREAELKRNISALEGLKGAASAPATTSPAPATAAAAAAAAASSEPAGMNVPLAAGAATTAAASAASAATTAAADTPTEASTVAPAPSASSAASAEAPAAAASTAAPAEAASASVEAPKPKAAAPAPAPVAEPSFLDGLMDNPLLPAAGAGLIALLAGLGIYRARQRKQKDVERDSEFIESRLQPDSFFGGSGGQQVNTKERPSGSSSSMAYSPSQLAAAGDVDPVAEADVYLAYGRDMQAEEILKEALLTHPGRISVHRKLAEIYAKRRDARALDAIATEAHALTQGDGPDWQAIVSLGAELDPNNPMYKPGGKPIPKVASTGTRRQFGADTEPQTAQVILSKDGTASTGRPPLDLKLDVGDSVRQAVPTPSTLPATAGIAAAAVGTAAAAASTASTSVRQAIETSAPVKADSEFVDLDLGGMDFAPPSELTAAAPPAPAQAASTVPPASNSGMIEFDMDALSIDPDSRSGDIKTEQPDVDEDPLSTKLSLAQEFRAIGDIDGARTLAAEVAAEAVGALKVRAERFLTEL